MSNDLVTRQEYSIDYNKAEVIQALKKTVAVGATDEEFWMFTEFCKSSGLNPLKKEIWFIKAGGRVQMMTGVNGFLAIANSNPNFDGMEVGLVDEAGEYKPMSYTGKILGAWCKVYRKDRKYPSEAVAMLKEYKKPTPIWNNMERVMIAKCAKSVAIREGFPQETNGLYTQEEMPADYAAPVNVTPAETIKPKVSQACMYRITPEQFDELGEKGHALYLYLTDYAKRQPNPEYWVSSKPLKKAERFICEWTEDALQVMQTTTADPVDVLFEAIEQGA